jgi:aminocarboxymuconate-semialdehyde decarboxylase
MNVFGNKESRVAKKSRPKTSRRPSSARPPARRKAPAVIRRRASSSPVIDFHAHIIDMEVCNFVKQNRPPEATEYQLVDNYIRGAAAQRRRHPRATSDEVEARLLDMDEFGIDQQVIFGHVAQYCYWAKPEDGARLARTGNDHLAEFVGRKPDRFIGMGMVPLQDTPAAVAELERMVKQLGFRAVAVNTHVDGMELGDEKLLPFWARAEQLGIPVFVHPSGFKHPRFTRHLMWNGVGQPIEEAIALSSLMYEGVLDRFPKLKLGIAHGGGFLPYYAGRIDRNFRNRPHETPKINREPSQYMKRLFYDTVVYNVDILEFLAHKVGPDRIVLGADYPVGEDNAVAFVKEAHLPAAAKRMILGENAAKLLGIPA